MNAVAMNPKAALMENAAARVMKLLVETTSGVQTAVVATSDGLPIASNSIVDFDAARLAAMASSIAAIGAVVVDETNVGECQSILVDSKDGYTLIVAIENPAWPAIMCVIAKKTAVLGQVMFAAREAARTLTSLSL